MFRAVRKEIRRLFKWKNSSTFGSAVSPQWFPSLMAPENLTIFNAESYTPIGRAINLISNDIGRMELSVEKMTDGEWKEIDSPIGELLKWRPNSLQCSYDFRRTIMRDLLLWGNSFALISSDSYGVREFIYCPPTTITQIDNGDGTFVYSHATYGPVKREEILHFHLNGQRPFWGESPIVRSARSLQLALIQEEAGAQLYRTPGLGKIALESEESISSDMVDLLQKSFASKHGGKDGAIQPIIVQGGMRATQVGQTLKDSDWIMSRRFSITEVSRMYSVPPAFLFDLEYSTLENTGAQMRSYISTCLTMYMNIFASEIYTKLLGDGERLTFNTTPLMMGTFREEMESLRMGLDAGIITSNEARAILGLESLEGGDEMTMSKNYAEKGVNGTDTKQDDEEKVESNEED
jgi:HK97 family phage portal protein|tara:strand:- start:1148 stop:2368 length:1221 start_codon:yes stop_codon:yes gene_type:complete